MNRIASMERLVILKNPILALGSRIFSMIMALGRIVLFLLKGFVLIFSLPLQISKIKPQILF
jgi:hypothetical protein